jgi:Na+-driven multidrug efflux pump
LQLVSSELLGFNRDFVQRYLKIALPVMFNEMMWSLGITIYNIIYARIGTESIAAVNISATIENMAFVLFIGISNAAAIMIGNRIGANEEHKAFDYGRRTLVIGIDWICAGGTRNLSGQRCYSCFIPDL